MYTTLPKLWALISSYIIAKIRLVFLVGSYIKRIWEKPFLHQKNCIYPNFDFVEEFSALSSISGVQQLPCGTFGDFISQEGQFDHFTNVWLVRRPNTFKKCCREDGCSVSQWLKRGVMGFTGKLGKAFFAHWELGKAKNAHWELGNGFFQ